MSDDDKPDYTVGYKRPPVEHQIKKGERRNPKGRPRRIERTIFLDQLPRDILSLAFRPVRIKSQGQEKVVSTTEAVLRSIASKALTGHGPSHRLFLKLVEQATQDYLSANEKALSFYKMINADMRENVDVSPNKVSVEMLNKHSRAVKKSFSS